MLSMPMFTELIDVSDENILLDKIKETNPFLQNMIVYVMLEDGDSLILNV